MVKNFQLSPDLCRRLASVPTSGGRMEDRLLLALADELERNERLAMARRDDPDTGK